MAETKFAAANEEVVKAGTEAVTKGYEQVIAMTKEQVEKFVPTAVKGFDDLAAIGKGNVDAAIKAGQIAAKGFEALGKEVTACNKKAFETGVANTKALLGAKTFQEAIELQTGFVRGSFDEFVANGTKFSELSIKLAQETVEPLTAQANKVVSEFTKQASRQAA